MAQNVASNQGVLLIAIFLNAYLFGLVSQQFYAYWITGFKDSLRLRLFVIVQFVIVAFQSLVLWYLAWILFVRDSSALTFGMPSPSPVELWEGPINSLGQLVLILMANMYLASRIYGLTKSRMQSGVVIALSVVAFILGMVTNVMAWKMTSFASVREGLSVAWHAVQAVAECLITLFLSRMLLKSRSGVPQTDSTVNHIVRKIFQTGFLATAWAILALATWFLLPKNNLAYRVFDVTSGTVYTHAIFETLLSRIRLRERMKLPSCHFELGLQSQEGRTSSKIRISGGHRASLSVSKVYEVSPRPLSTSGSEAGLTRAGKPDVIALESWAVE